MNYTVNNEFEIRHPVESLTANSYHDLLAELGLKGQSPAERVASFRRMSVEDVAELMDVLNQRLQGSEETLLSHKTMRVGEEQMVPVEHRYDLFETLVDKLQSAPLDINPARIGDALGLMTVMLHPFHDGNGRTSRMIGYAFQPEFDSDDLEKDFEYYATSREERRGKKPFAYIPHMPEGADRANPDDVVKYFDDLINSDRSDLYTGTYSGLKKASPRTVGVATE